MGLAASVKYIGGFLMVLFLAAITPGYLNKTKPLVNQDEYANSLKAKQRVNLKLTDQRVDTVIATIRRESK